VPIENVVFGTVQQVQDLLAASDVVAVGEVIVPVRLCLAALPGQRLEDIERVYSHVQALGQAEAFLRSRPWSLLAATNTAGSGKMLVDRGERGSAAVLSPRAAKLFGLEVLLPTSRASRGTGPASSSSRTRHHGYARPSCRDALDAPVAVRNEPGTLVRVLLVLAVTAST